MLEFTMESRFTQAAVAMAALDWVWTTEFVMQKVGEIGFTKLTEYPGRLEFEDSSGLILCIYFDDGENHFNRIELTADDFVPKRNVEYFEFDEKMTAFSNDFHNRSTKLIKKIGTPQFSGQYGSDGYPDDQDAILITLWRSATAIFSLQLQNVGDDMPIILCFVVEPEAKATNT